MNSHPLELLGSDLQVVLLFLVLVTIINTEVAKTLRTCYHFYNNLIVDKDNKLAYVFDMQIIITIILILKTITFLERQLSRH